MSPKPVFSVATKPLSTAVVSPATIGRFRVLRELGKGAQGVVYLAQDPQLQRNVAIKTLRLQFKELREQQTMLLQEARTVGRLSHPNIISIYEAGEFEGRPYLVFEFVDGLSLKEYLKKNGPLPISRSLGMISQILAGIANAHEHNILHGDLSPHNIIVDRNGVPRIMDFGVARFIGSRQDATLGMWGSLAYMSPEHFNNSPLTGKSDIFAIGLILFEMLINQPVVQSDNQFAIINAIANHPIEPPSVRNSALDKTLDDIVMRALEKEPEARYESADAMRKTIEEYLSIEQQQTNGKSEGTTSKQSALDFLLRRMRFKMDFPALSHHIMEINKKAASLDQTSAADLANVILKDYGLTSKLLKLVNSSFYRRSTTRISTVSRAVTLLGFEQVRTAALGLMLMEHIRNGQQREELKDEVITGFLNGVIGKDMAERIKFKEPEEAFICSMFHNLGHLLTIYYFPEEHAEIKNLIERKGISEDTATNSVLGLSYEDLGQGISQAWQFPDKISLSMRSLSEGKAAKPSTDTDLLRLLSNFSSELSTAATSADDKRAEQLKGIVTRFGGALPVTAKNIDELVNTAASNVRKYADALNIRLESSPYYKRLIRAITNSTSDASPGPAASASATGTASPSPGGFGAEMTMPAGMGQGDTSSSPEDTPERIMQDSIQEISNALLEEYNLNEILITILETIYRGFGFSHVLFCVLDKNRATVNVRFGFGNEIEEITRGMKISLKNKPDVFNISISQGRDIIISDIDDKSFSSFIPGWFRNLVSARSVLLYPIMVNGAPIGLIYADHDRLGALGAGTPLTLLKTLRNQAIMAIKQKASR
ncbi:eukaryotic-like serine/threonine-protein kinase [Gammaproteobacteria bacterium]